MSQHSITLGFIPANRGFFSDKLAADMREKTIRAMKAAGVGVAVPSEKQTKVGCVETLPEAELCAGMFRRENVQGIVVGAMNFGDEQAVAWTVRQCGLDVPILIFGCQEEEVLRKSTSRRDSFCGLLSIGDALRQIGAKYTAAQRPICYPTDGSFAKDLDWFVRLCRVVNGVKGARYAQLGTRPEAFWTCRYDEHKLQHLGPTVVVQDFSEVLAGLAKISDADPDVQRAAAEIREYADCSKAKAEPIVRQARFEVYLRRFAEEHGIDAFAVQCWSSIQNNYGICACSTMSRLGNEGIPCACEVDVLGALSMHAALLASDSPAGLADWNNLHNEDDDLVNVWHCGVFPKCFAGEQPTMGANEILVSGGATRAADSVGLVEFRCKPGPLTLFRLAQEAEGPYKAIVAEGEVEDNRAKTFGAYGWCRIPNLQRFYRDVLLNHCPHHVAITQGHAGNALYEAFGKYLSSDVYHATQETPGLYTPRLPF